HAVPRQPPAHPLIAEHTGPANARRGPPAPSSAHPAAPRHGSITARSRLDHGSITARSRLDHGSITARSRLDHGFIDFQSAPDSHALASLYRLLSPNCLPTSMRPAGRPSLRPHGIVSAGCPLTSNGAQLGSISNPRARISAR